jgi:hypothetical protein
MQKHNNKMQDFYILHILALPPLPLLWRGLLPLLWPHLSPEGLLSRPCHTHLRLRHTSLANHQPYLRENGRLALLRCLGKIPA